MFKNVPNYIVNQLNLNHDELLNFLIKKNSKLQSLPLISVGNAEVGEAYTLTNPILGVKFRLF